MPLALMSLVLSTAPATGRAQVDPFTYSAFFRILELCGLINTASARVLSCDVRPGVDVLDNPFMEKSFGILGHPGNTYVLTVASVPPSGDVLFGSIHDGVLGFMPVLFLTNGDVMDANGRVFPFPQYMLGHVYVMMHGTIP